MASAAFVKALEKKKNMSKMLNASKEAEKKGAYTLPEIRDGSYICAVRAECGVTPNKNVPYVKFLWSIVDDSEFNGKGADKTIFLGDDDEARCEKAFTSLGKSFKILLDTDELDIQSAADVPALVDAINADKIYARTAIKRWEKGDKWGYNVFFNERVVEE